MCGSLVTKNGILNVLKLMKNNKTPENDSLAKEFKI